MPFNSRPEHYSFCYFILYQINLCFGYIYFSNLRCCKLFTQNIIFLQGCNADHSVRLAKLGLQPQLISRRKRSANWELRTAPSHFQNRVGLKSEPLQFETRLARSRRSDHLWSPVQRSSVKQKSSNLSPEVFPRVWRFKTSAGCPTFQGRDSAIFACWCWQRKLERFGTKKRFSPVASTLKPGWDWNFSWRVRIHANSLICYVLSCLRKVWWNSFELLPRESLVHAYLFKWCNVLMMGSCI